MNLHRYGCRCALCASGQTRSTAKGKKYNPPRIDDKLPDPQPIPTTKKIRTPADAGIDTQAISE